MTPCFYLLVQLVLTAAFSTRRSSSILSGDSSRPRKLHIPVTGLLRGQVLPAGDDAEGYPVVELGAGRFGFSERPGPVVPGAGAPLAGPSEVIVYPTAIGLEPTTRSSTPSRCGSG